MLTRYVFVAAALSLAPAAWAQSAAEHIALGDREFGAAHALPALQQYEAAIVAEPNNYEALWKASREAIDVGESENDKNQRTALFEKGQQYARRAVAVRPNDAEGHFHLARSLGKAALASSPRDKIKYGTEVRAQALEALKYDPNHPGALHVMGMWNAEIMRLNGATRWIAKNVLGGDVMGTANWKSAVSYMEKAVAVDPNRIIHHLDLAGIYLEDDVNQKAKGRAQLEMILRMTPTEPNEDRYQQQARALLQKIS